MLACSALTLIGLFIASHRRPAGPVNVALRNRLVGSWAGENGVVLEFRSDGTATSRSTVRKREDLYFDWTVSNSELAVFQSSSRSRSVGWMVNRHVFNRPTDRYDVKEVMPNQIELVDITSSKPLRLMKLDDAQSGVSPPAKP